VREEGPSTFGFPLMHLERGERRAFLPCLMAELDAGGAEVLMIEQGYGEPMGIPVEEYLAASKKVRVGSWDECLAQDVVVQVRCPSDEALRQIRPDAVLVAMLHYPTRPGRVAMLTQLDIRCVSLDSVVDDLGRRLVENMRAVGWNGTRAAFQQLASSYRRFDVSGRRPIRTTVLGAGAVAGHAIQAATRYGDDDVHRRLGSRHVLGVEVTVLDQAVTWDENTMASLLERTDLLVDATRRVDPTRPVIPNEWLESLPQHAVALDLAADPYDFASAPPHVKGIEGIPQGSLDQYVFGPDDPVYESMDPRIDTTNRRLAVSCYSWPGVEPLSCMEVYSRQVEPVLRVLLEHPIDSWDAIHGTHDERAVARAELGWWRRTHLR
jgi:alanine dehydrogenase